MDPYLEGYLWPDVHQRLAAEISRQLTPLIRPRYVARLAVYVVEDTAPEVDLGIFYPDVEVPEAARRHQVSETALGSLKNQGESPSLPRRLLCPCSCRSRCACPKLKSGIPPKTGWFPALKSFPR
jgi:hypothetical protein